LDASKAKTVLDASKAKTGKCQKLRRANAKNETGGAL